MSKYSKLLKNTGIFFIANFGSKILAFLLVRFYTEYLSTQEYGIVDLLITTSSLAFPIVTLCVTEAVLRFSIDDKDNRSKILTNGLLVALIGNLAFVFSAPLFSKIDTFTDNVGWIYLLTLSNSLYSILAHFSRGIGKSNLFAMSGVIHTILQLVLNVLFLAAFSLGIKGYLIASVLANIITALYVFIFGRLHTYIIKNVDKKYMKTMLIYAMPLIPNAVFWWMMQSSNRYIILYMLSSSANGLYAAANKIPTLITTFSGIFFQAWQISSVEESSSEQKTKFYADVFSALSMLLSVGTSFVLVILQPLYRLLTEESYYAGWTCVPFLLCATLFSCYSSFLGTNYVAMKKTKGVFLTTVVGAISNVVFNFLLIPLIGLEGSALATFIAFFITWVLRILGTRNFVKIKYCFMTFWIPTMLILCQAVLLTVGVNSMLIQLGFSTLICLFYSREIIKYLKFVLQYIRSKRG